MKINQRERIIGSSGNQGGVSIATNLKREREMLDKFGNIIDPRTKQIIKRVEDKN